MMFGRSLPPPDFDTNLLHYCHAAYGGKPWPLIKDCITVGGGGWLAGWPSNEERGQHTEPASIGAA